MRTSHIRSGSISTGNLILLVIFVAGIALIFWPKGSGKHGSGVVPAVKVVDATDDSSASDPRFSQWRTEGYNLVGRMVWDGTRRIDSLGYTVRSGGTVKTRGSVIVPGAGMRKGEPTEVTVLLWEEPTADMVVTIEVMY